MDYSKITENLYIGSSPNTTDCAMLHELGVKLVINMRLGAPPRHDPLVPPFKNLWLPTLDSPFFPIPVALLKIGVREALEVIRNGGVVYTHCSKGRHRGPAMGACILIAQGLTLTDAILLIKQQRPSANPEVWYIRRQIAKFLHDWSGLQSDIGRQNNQA